MPQKSARDREVEDRIRAHLRQEMRERKLGNNAAARKLGMSAGNLSKILKGGGFGVGTALAISKTFTIPEKILMDENPPAIFFRRGSEDWKVPLPAKATHDGPPPGTPSAALPPGQSRGRNGTGRR